MTEDFLDELAVQVQAMIITPKQFREKLQDYIQKENQKARLSELQHIRLSSGSRLQKEIIDDRIAKIKELTDETRP